MSGWYLKLAITLAAVAIGAILIVAPAFANRPSGSKPCYVYDPELAEEPNSVERNGLLGWVEVPCDRDPNDRFDVNETR